MFMCKICSKKLDLKKEDCFFCRKHACFYCLPCGYTVGCPKKTKSCALNMIPNDEKFLKIIKNVSDSEGLSPYGKYSMMGMIDDFE